MSQFASNPSSPLDEIRAVAYARAGLLGNPSDGYGGKTISCTLKNWAAEVCLRPAPRLRVIAGDDERHEFDSLGHLINDVRRHGYYGGVRIIKATLKRFGEYLGAAEPLPALNFELEYRTCIPRQLGLGGSSALVVATLRALQKFFDVEVSPLWLPSLALSVETRELGIPAGLQDRVIQCWEGLVAMDFSSDATVSDGDLVRGTYERLDPASLPPLYVACAAADSEPTEVVHGSLRHRFEQGDPQVRAAMLRFAELAQAGRDAIQARDFARLGRLMDENFDLRRTICDIHPRHLQMVEVARGVGVPAKFCGSGGAIVGILSAPDQWDPLVAGLSAIGCTVERAKV